MAYKTHELEKKALEAIQKSMLVFIHEVADSIGIDKGTFYDHKLHENHAIKEALEANKTKIKQGLRKKMYDSDTPTGWAMLYKLVGTEEESDRINSQRTKLDVEGGIKITVDFSTDD